MIKTIGKECFDNSSDFDYLRDPNIPFCFLFIFKSFIEIFNCCHENITWTDIASYAIIRKIDFKQIEIDYILKCNNWANAQIQEMRDGERPKPKGEEEEQAQI